MKITPSKVILPMKENDLKELFSGEMYNLRYYEVEDP